MAGFTLTNMAGRSALSDLLSHLRYLWPGDLAKVLTPPVYVAFEPDNWQDRPPLETALPPTRGPPGPCGRSSRASYSGTPAVIEWLRSLGAGQAERLGGSGGEGSLL